MAASSSGAGSGKPKFVPQNLNDIYGRRTSSAAAKSKQPVDALSNGPAAAARGKSAGGGGERGMLVLSVPVKKERPPIVLPPPPAAAPVIPNKESQISASNPSHDKGKFTAAADAAIATSAPASASNLDLDTQKSTCSDLNPATASNSSQDNHKPTIAAADNISLRPQRIFPRKPVNADDAAHDTKYLGLIKNESTREHSPVVDAVVPAKRPEPFRPPHLRTTTSTSSAAAAAPRGSHLRGHDPESKSFLRPNQEQKQEPRDGYSPVATTSHDAEFSRPISATFQADNNRSLGFGHARQGRDRERERERERERDYHGRSSQIAGLANTRFESQANRDYSVSQFQSQFHRGSDHHFRGSGSHTNQYSGNPNAHRSSIEGYERNPSSIALDSRRSSSGIHGESFPIPTDIQGHRGQLKVRDRTDSERRSPMQQIQNRSRHQEKLFTADDDPFYKGNPGDSNHKLSGMLGSSLSLKEIHKPEFPTRVQKEIEWKSPEALSGHKMRDGKHMEARRRSSSIIGGYSHDSSIYSQDSHLSKPNSSFEHRQTTEDRQPSSKLIRSYNHYSHEHDYVSNFRKTNHQFNRGMEHKTNSYESRSSSSSWRKEGNHSRSSESQGSSSQNNDSAFK